MSDKKKPHSSDVFNKVKLMQVGKKKSEIDLETVDYTSRSGFIKAFMYGVKRADVSSAGAQLAYFFLLSMFPLLLFMLSLLPYLNLPQEQVFSLLEDILPNEVYSLIEGIIHDVLTNRSGSLLSVGIIATLWSASNGVNALVKNLNKSYGINETRPFLIVRSVSLIFTVLLIVLILVALILPVFGKTIGVYLFSTLGIEDGFLTLWNYIRLIMPPVIIFIVLVLLYWIGPSITLYFKSAIPGAIFSTIGWVLISFGFSFYINNFANYSKTYGSIGGIIILMLWLYITGIVLVIGGQINVTMQRRKEQILRERQKTNAIKVK